MIDLEELKRLARDATPGPWSTKEYGPDHLEVLLPNGFSRIISDPTVVTDYDARYIAAANPAAVLALIERVEKAEAALKGLHTDVSAALAEAERQSTGTHGMSVPYTGPFASGLRLPSVVRDLREQQRVISAALEAK